MTAKEDVFSEHVEITEFVVACLFVCFCGLALARLVGAIGLELIFGSGGCATLLVVLGYRLWAQSASRTLSMVDAAVAIVWATEVTALAASTYRRNSFDAVLNLAFLTVLYILLRALIICWSGLKWISLVLAVFGAALSTAQARIVAQWVNRAFRAGFTDMSALKARYPTLIIPLLNDWPTTVLLFMSFSLLTSVIKTRTRVVAVPLVISAICNVALVSCLLLTLSRGAYLGLAVLWIVLLSAMAVFQVDERRICVSVAVSVLLSVIIVSIVAPPMRAEFGRIAFGKQSVSQARSTQGHFAIWASAWSIARSHPLFGVGPGNFAMHYVPEVGKNFEGEFAGRPFSLALQVLVERGIIGVASFSLLLWALLLSEYRSFSRLQDNLERCASIICISALAAILVRELTYSSLLTNPQASLLIWLLMASIASRGSVSRPTTLEVSPQGRGERIQEKAVTLAFMLIVSGSIIVFYIAFRHAKAAAMANVAARYWAAGEYEEGFESIGLAIKNDPGNAYYIATQGLEQGRLALPPIQAAGMTEIRAAVDPQQIGLLNASIASYRNALKANPLDDNFANNLGWLYFYAGDSKSAERYVRRAAEINSGEAIYHIGLGLLLEVGQQMGAANYEYSVAATLKPEFIESPAFRSLRLGRPARADEIITNSISMLKAEAMQTSSPIVWARLGALLLKSGHEHEAIPFLQDAVRSLPGLSLAWRNLGIALEDVGSHQDADAAFRKWLFLQTTLETANDPPDLSGVRGTINETADVRKRISEIPTYPRATEHAVRISRLYRTNALVLDDVLPPGFLEICTRSQR
jgi:tetratricopeptide (TPR) repeat protein